MSNTTQEGEEDIIKTGNPKRDEMMNTLVDVRNSDSEIINEEESEPEELPIVKGEDGHWYGRRIIDGEEELVPWNDLVADSQKVKAAQKRFEEAAMLRSEAQELRDEAGRLSVEQQQVLQQDPLPSDEEDDEALVEIIKEYHKALYDDDEEQAIKLMKQIRGREAKAVATPFDPNEARRLVDQAVSDRLEEQKKQSFENDLAKAQERFAEDYDDIANDEVLRGIADQKTVTIMNDNPDLSPWEIIEQASNETRSWVKQSLGTVDGREARKRATDSQPASAGAKSTMGSENEKPQTRSDVIQELKRLRNQTL